MPDNTQPTPTPVLQLKVGKKYKNRLGNIISITSEITPVSFYYSQGWRFGDSSGFLYNGHGSRVNGSHESGLDLVAEHGDITKPAERLDDIIYLRVDDSAETIIIDLDDRTKPIQLNIILNGKPVQIMTTIAPHRGE